jgi:hypothetical protein
MIANHIVAATGKSFDELFLGGKVKLLHRNGKTVIKTWDVEGYPEPTQEQLDAWAAEPDIHGLCQHAYAKKLFILKGGITVNVGAESPVKIDTSPDHIGALPRLMQLASLDNDRIFDWGQTPKSIKLTSAQVRAAVKAAYEFEQNCWSALARLKEKIAKGEITSIEEMDSFKWPSSTL